MTRKLIFYTYSLKRGEVLNTDEIDEDVWIEYDENGEVMGIEIWNAGEKVIMNALREIEKHTKGQKAKIY